MGRRMQIVPHVSVEEVTEKLKTTTNDRQREQWLVISNGLVDARPADRIALHTATSRWFVSHTVSDDNQLGSASIAEDRRGGRHHASRTQDEEQAFLEPFIAQAEAGHLVTTHTIQQAFADRVGQSVYASTIADLLHRNDWRTITPRPQHPQTDAENQAR
ncbi:MAG: winged helix-turn-helix domain-containing protein [Chloroflexaceae bacterium]